ncbi:hypothetical protein IHE31_01145 (plasmid) [Mycetohabitans rhizoxinica]|jgi:hypothetical protein|uniref:Uncharacterized protein n=1 Tax=Mycetohabitans rhizoxinica TaxID=412963 RepID=A0ABZ2PZV7_9BURK|nr:MULTISPECIES: hypothetical protein [Mycetohabitans]MCG1048554.1 hypothetical protein [Mycetohabitans sp. B6]
MKIDILGVQAFVATADHGVFPRIAASVSRRVLARNHRAALTQGAA